jgi:Pentapeptide repeats (8 copies)
LTVVLASIQADKVALPAIALFALALLVGGGLLLFRRSEASWTIGERWELSPADRRSLGASLLTGAFISLALTGAQIFLNGVQDDRSKEEQFRLSIAMAHDLSGLDPSMSLEGMSLPGKNLDRAQLADEDLSEVNLEGASLREADLSDADLSDANLSRADLTGAKLVGADLTDANLQFANLTRTQLVPPHRSAVGVTLDGTKVNARTCWPADVLANPSNHLKRRLETGSTVVGGQVKAGPSLGTSCELLLENLIHSFKSISSEKEPAITIGDISSKLGLKSRRVLDTLEGSGLPPDPEGPLERFPRPAEGQLCAGGRGIQLKDQPEQGFTVVLISRPATPIASTIVVFRPGRLTTTKPLEPRSAVAVLAGRSTDYAPKVLRHLRVEQCRTIKVKSAGSPGDL